LKGISIPLTAERLNERDEEESEHRYWDREEEKIDEGL
jgi:hypothetical protein